MRSYRLPGSLMAAAIAASMLPVSAGAVFEPETGGTYEPGFYSVDPTSFGQVRRGDVNHDGEVDVMDLILLQKSLHGYGAALNAQAADLVPDGSIDVYDMSMLKREILSPSEPPSEPPAEPPAEPPTDTPSQPGAYMNRIRDSLTAVVPADMASRNPDVDYGTLEPISYYSTIARKEKRANVLLPAGYDSSKSYPVLYVNHGIFGDCQSMLDDGMGVVALAGNLAAAGEAEQMIIVFTSMYTSENTDQCVGFTPEETAKYDAFREDLTECLMPYINEHYAARTGRASTAISGFSMGGRETLYIGMTKSDVFGYIGAACPAPGIVPAQDNMMKHPGNMQPSEFKVTGTQPEVLFIAGGTNDGVVGNFPQQYHALLEQNGQEHLWLEVQGGGHDGSTVVPMFYNFLRNVFKS